MDHRTPADSAESIAGTHCDGSRGCGMGEHLPDTVVPLLIVRAGAGSLETLANTLPGGSQDLLTHAAKDESGAGLAASEIPIDGPAGAQGTGTLGQRNRPPDRRLRAEAGAVHPPRHASQAVTPCLRARGEVQRPAKGRPAISRAEQSC